MTSWTSSDTHVRALVLGPPPGSAGGIGRMHENLRDAWASANVRLSFVDTISSYGAFARAMFAATFQAFDVAVLATSQGGSFVRKAILSAILTLRKKPYILHLHASSFDRFFIRVGPLGRSAIRAVFRKASAVVVLGERWREWAVEAGVQPDTVVVLPNAVEIPKELLEKVPGRVAFVGRVGSRKGAHECVRAVRLVQEKGIAIELHLAGDIEAGFEVPGGPGLHVHGWLDREQTARLLSTSEIFILPSQAEGLPLSLLEAMAAQAVPMVTSAGSMGEAVDAEVGVILQSGSAVEIAEGLERLMTQRELINNLGAKARARALCRYDIRRYVERYANLLEECATRGGQRR